MQINSFLAYLCNYSRSTTKNRPKKHDFSPHPALQSNGTDFAVQNPRIDDIEKQVEQEVQLVSRLVEYIRVMKDKTIIIVLKGGLQIEEKLEQI